MLLFEKNFYLFFFLIFGLATFLINSSGQSFVPRPVWLEPSGSFKPDKKITPEKRFVIVVMSYNNKNWYRYNLDSIFAQKYPYFRVIYCDDCSQDNTALLVDNYLCDNNNADRVTLIRNKIHRSKAANIYDVLHSCQDDEIAVILDGDDWFAHCHVLTYLNEIYTKHNTWLTYGGNLSYPNNVERYCEPISPEIVVQNNFRKISITTALRSFYVWLFKQIKIEDFFFEGRFMPMAGDVAKMYPMFEMAGKHFWQNNHITYIYNRVTNINDDKVNVALQKKINSFVRNKKHYQPLKHRPLYKNIDQPIRLNIAQAKIMNAQQYDKLSTYVLLQQKYKKYSNEQLINCAQQLEKTGAKAYFLNMNKTNFRKPYIYEIINNNVGVWQFAYGPKLTPHLLDSVLLRKNDIKLFIHSPKAFLKSSLLGLFNA